jgi:organic radical activating enzyme
LYVQFYVTARCNLTCKQCNIIYANADIGEVSVAQVKAIAANLAAIGTGVVLLTGGEPSIGATYRRSSAPSRGTAFAYERNQWARDTRQVAASGRRRRARRCRSRSIRCSQESRTF